MRLIDADALLETLELVYWARENESKYTGNRAITVTWKDAIITVKNAPTIEPEHDCEKCVFKPFKQFQPERKKGKWIPVTRIEKWHKEDGLVGFPPEVKEFPQCTIEWVDATEPDEVDGLRCSECGTVYDFTEARNWCSECGAEMGGTG